MHGDDDCNRPVRVPLRSPNDGQDASGRPANSSEADFLREGYQVLDRAERNIFGETRRRGLSRPVYPGDSYHGFADEGDY